MIEKKSTGDWFHKGRGGPQSLAKDVGGSTDVAAAETAAGKKPVFSTGAGPFHEGRGSGRGHSV